MICDGILRWNNTNAFVMCDLEEGHKGNHTALNFEWKDKKEVHSEKEHKFHMDCFKRFFVTDNSIIDIQINEGFN